MTQVRIQQTEHWGSVPEALLEDSRLSLDTRSVASWLAIKPHGWQIRVAPLCHRLGVGRDRWRRIAKELEATRRLRRKRIQLEGGKWGWVFEFDPLGRLPPSEPDVATEASKQTPSVNEYPAITNSENGERPLTPEEKAWIDLEIEATNLAHQQGKGNPIVHPTRFKAFKAREIRAGEYEPSASAKSLKKSREAEAELRKRLARPPPRLAALRTKQLPTEDPFVQIKEIVGLS